MSLYLNVWRNILKYEQTSRHVHEATLDFADLYKLILDVPYFLGHILGILLVHILGKVRQHACRFSSGLSISVHL